jgi:phosphate transport system substrate-binding protein
MSELRAAESHTPNPAEGMLKPSIVNAPGAASYPICGFTHLLVYQDLNYLDGPKQAQALITFLKWALSEGQTVAPELHYMPLPENLRKRSLALVETMAYPAPTKE